jgi:methoxymalonate biosynthesis protein
LDDTLWHGELRNGEAVEPKENALQLLRLADTCGILQSIASRNDHDTAMAVLKEWGIAEYFLYPQINGAYAKSASIRKIARYLNIDCGSVAFIDDNPFELYEVRRFLPETDIYPAEDMHTLRERVEAMTQNGPTSNRRELMQMRERRQQAEEAFCGSREDFLMECRITLTVREAREADIDRAAELAARSNKLNNTRERMDVERLRACLADANRRLLVCELDDIFGNHGIVGLCLMRFSPSLYIDLFCISCRVEGRGIGAAFLGETIRQTIKGGINEVFCVYKPYKKDKSAFLLLKLLGFTVVVKEQGQLTMKWARSSDKGPDTLEAPEWVQVRGFS